MYAFLTGPALWATFIIFFGGIIVRIVFLFSLSLERDKVFYNHASFRWGLKSIFHWLVPWGSIAMRQQPIFTFVAFAFHISILTVPLFLDAHNTLWDETLGISLWSMPDRWADIMTVILICSGLFLLIRRVVRREVRILTSAWDYILLILTILPFATGFLAYYQCGPYKTLLLVHILSGEILIVLIPFTKLGHMILFFFTRAFIGFEMGSRRGARSW